MIIKVENLTKSFGNTILFENVNLLINEGEKIGLIAQNGAGKTSLINCIIGNDLDYTGNIMIKDGLKISVMEQEKLFEGLDINFETYIGNKRKILSDKKEEMEALFCDSQIIEDSEKYAKLISDYDQICKVFENDIDNDRLIGILENLNFLMDNYKTKICNLSGGERTKLRLAEALAKDADLYILDEPTNHLDFMTINWMEQRFADIGRNFLIISHDRYFLNKIVNKIVEIENKDLIIYKTNYKNYVIKKDARLIAMAKKHFSVLKEKKRLDASIKEKREWAHLAGSSKLKAIADRMQRSYDNLGDTFDPNSFTQIYDLKFNYIPMNPKFIFDANAVSKAFDKNFLFKDSKFEVLNGEKVALIGLNGCGKTTLIKILNQMDTFSEGELKIANDLRVGYFDQEFKNLNLNQKIIDFLWDSNSALNEHEIIGTAIKFGIPKSKLDSKVKILSGGEKARLSLISLMLKKTNLLLLDEPTNHLDVELIESLEFAIKNFSGTVIFISHDRYFIDNVANKILFIDENKIKELIGNFSDNF